MNTDQLPPLPEADVRTDCHIDGFGEPAFTADQMRSYAARAVAAERERCAKVCDGIAKDYAAVSRRFKGESPAAYLDGRSDCANECAKVIRKGIE